MDDRSRRVGDNEVLFREVNARIEELETTFSVEGDMLTILCECGDVGCTARISLAPERYAAVRAHGDRFIVVPEHVDESVEYVVGRDATSVVIEKREVGPAERARADLR